MLHHAHEADAELLQSQPKETTISVEVSSQTEIIPVKVNDTVGTIVEANTKVTTTDAAKIPKYVAFDAAVDKVEELNKDGALADGILQADKETLIVPDEITVSPDTTDSK